ncbi:MAG: 16S rRNA (adenine(1518)-N(6)/adenine(1519)-N(6))-dimethyltransferase RsmA [Treponema sp.]
MIDYSSPSSIKLHLKTFNFAMQKRWGQNFLIDEKVRKAIALATGNIEGKTVWEVGPGLGAMTISLKEKGASLTLFEIDKGFITFLSQQFKDAKIIQGDVLKTWKIEMKKNGIPSLFFSCLPYNISIDLLSSFFKELAIFDKMVITVQKEVADKILSKEGEKTYSPISIFSSYFYDVKRVLNIAPSSFWPQPHVTSSCLTLTKKEKRECKNEKLFISCINALFSSRRRTIKNNFSKWLEARQQQTQLESQKETLLDSILKKAKIDPSSRAEDLALDDFIKLINAIE